MKKISLSFALTFLMATSNLYATTEPSVYLQSLARFLPTLQKNAANLWPSFYIDKKPLIVWGDNFGRDHGDDLYLFNYIPTNPLWIKKFVDNIPMYEMEHDALGVHDNESSSLMNPYFMLENQQAILFSF